MILSRLRPAAPLTFGLLLALSAAAVLVHRSGHRSALIEEKITPDVPPPHFPLRTDVPPAVDSHLALEALGGESISVEADRLDIDVTAGTALLEGHITLGKGDLKIGCPKVEISFDTSPKVHWVKATGGVSADMRGVHADAPEAYIDLQKKRLELRGGVRLQRGGGVLEADKAVFDLSTGKVSLTKVKGSIPVPK